MNQEAVTVIEEKKHTDDLTRLRGGRPSAHSAVQLPQTSSKPNFGARLKSLLTKIFEGNHDFHNYLGH